ncbi:MULTISPECIES: hypothetical protein [Spirulina sp. CCY15215]|nr:hypothetical protein [Spirulina major]
MSHVGVYCRKPSFVNPSRSAIASLHFLKPAIAPLFLFFHIAIATLWCCE